MALRKSERAVMVVCAGGRFFAPRNFAATVRFRTGDAMQTATTYRDWTGAVQPTIVVIDDVDDALALLTAYGRSIVGPPTMPIRNAINLYCAIHRWTSVRHVDFLSWARRFLAPTRVWLVLDPLVQQESLSSNAHRLRLTRVVGKDGSQLTGILPEPVQRAVQATGVGILDDAASSGGTIMHVASLVEEAGGRVEEVIVCAATEHARLSVMKTRSSILWRQFVAGDTACIHLRDVCPGLPYSGRRIAEYPPIDTPAGPLGLRLAPVSFSTGLWSQVGADRHMQRAIMDGWRAFAHRFSQSLGRPAVLTDVRLLGEYVEAPIFTKRTVSHDSSLEQVLT